MSNEHEEPDPEDPFSTAKGIAAGCLLSVLIWMVLIGIAQPFCNAERTSN